LESATIFITVITDVCERYFLQHAICVCTQQMLHK